jgi:hypothetical protein
MAIFVILYINTFTLLHATFKPVQNLLSDVRYPSGVQSNNI